MTPTTQVNCPATQHSTMGTEASNDAICITGISGSFPESNSVQHLGENLFNKVDLITDDDRRWKKTDPAVPHRSGKINNIEKFDASFFEIDYKQAHSMDPMARVILERTYEAIIDAGYNPSELRGTKTGVFLGVCFSEAEMIWFYDKAEVNDNSFPGCSRSMIATRISQWLGISGPSYSVDTACSSSLYALEHAVTCMRNGECDAAIVTGLNILLHPNTTLQFSRLGVLSPDGRCKSFDSRANGYVRSETIAAIFLQKAKDSRRIHAEVVHAKTNCDGYKEQGITYPAGHIQKQLLEGFYSECGVPPASLEYVEAHGTGTNVGDPEELNAIDDIFCTGRSDPLLIGSVKSNLGHSEPSSGVCSIAKVCVAYNTGYIPPNINFIKAKDGIPALAEGRLKVVTEKTPWNRGMVGISSFGFGGANAHILMKNISRAKVNNGLPADNLPRLVCVSGRTETAVAKILNDLESRTVDVDEIRLWHAVHERDIARHNFRGYVLLGSELKQSVRLGRDIQPIQRTKKPLCFVYSSAGINWPAMARQLMAIPAFTTSIQKCQRVLERKGFDLIQLINESNINSKDSERYCLVGVVATQIALTDLLDAVNIKPDYVIGHDVGELLCAYADGCLSLEQTILAAYSVVLASETVSNNAVTVNVGLGCDQVKDTCPPELDVAYHTSPETCCVSGPADVIKTFATELSAQGILVDEFPTNCKVAYHSRYAVETASKLVQYLREVIPSPRPRSDRWVSTSVPQPQWKDAKDLLSSAEYHANSLIVPVLFEESSHLLPSNAVWIEVGPQTLPFNKTQAETVKIPLMDNCKNLQFFFTALGKLYEAGLNPNLAKIYPPVQFPVAQGTPFLAHLIEWEHSESWTLVSFNIAHAAKTCENTIKFSLTEEYCEYLVGHCIDGRVIYPATGYLLLAWQTLAQINAVHHWDMSVVFEDVYFERATNVPKDAPLQFTVVIQRGSGNFEIIESGTSVVVGRIYQKKNAAEDYKPIPSLTQGLPKNRYSKYMSRKDFYKELSLRGYQYSGAFRGVLGCSIDGTRGLLEWDNNWVTFLDTMLQAKIVTHDTRSLYVPTRIEKVSIDVDIHSNIISHLELNETKSVPFQLYPEAEVTRCGGVEIRGIHVTAISKKNPLGIPVLENNEFVPNFTDSIIPFADSLRSKLQLILENVPTYKFKTVELVDEQYKNNGIKPIIELVNEILSDIPLIQAESLVYSEESLELPSTITVSNKKISGESNVVLFVGGNLLKRPEILEEATSTLKKNCFILSREKCLPSKQEYLKTYDIITSHHTETEYLVLLRKKINSKPTTYYIEILTTDQSYSWINKIKDKMNGTNKIVLYSQNDTINGLLGFVNCLTKESGGDVVKGFLIADQNAPKFNPDCQFYKEQLEKDLTINVYKNGHWGTYRHLLLKDLDTVPATHAYVNTATIGDLTSLRWWQGAIVQDEPSAKGLINIHVYSSAMNFRDVMTAMGRVTLDAVARGRLAQDCVQGIEISGRSSSGHRTMAICEKGISNMVQVDETLAWPIPDEWTFEEACTVPVAYGTVYMALVMVGKIRRGESILIHAGSGGVGQAAINVALHYGLEVFTTVGTPAKRAFIKRLFPQLKDSHIGNSRDTSFEQMIRRETNGKGVDAVLNSLADDKLQASAKCLRRRGRFLEIGKYDITINTQVEMCFFKKEISFHGIMLDFISDEQTLPLRIKLKDLVLEGIASGAVRPLTYCAFEKDEIEAAYRYMAAGKHIGKVIIKIREDKYGSALVKPSPCIINAIPRYMCNKDDVYVLIGGMGGFGLELADWLVLRGARKILMSSRRGISNGYQALRLRIWATYGAEVQISTHDVTTEQGCEEMLKKANTMGPVRAVFNLAVILSDAVFTNQTPETFKTSFGPKAATTIHLDKLTRKMCPQLKDFVIFSSVSCGRGNAGQTNYGFSNSVMERICEKRKSQGLPALAIQWGAIGDVGLVADMQEDNQQLEIGGTLQQRISSCLQALDKFLKQNAPVVSSIVVAEKRSSGSSTGSIVDAVAAIMGITDLKTVSQQVALSELGMDSIMAVEIKQTLEREFEIFLNAQEIRTLTFTKLLELAAQRDAESGASNSSAPAAVSAAAAIVPAGVGLLIRNLGDENTAYKHYIDMPSLATKKLKGNQSVPTMFLVPGVEGAASTLASLCSKLAAETCVLQYDLDNPSDDVDQMADKFLKVVKSRLAPNTPFCLLGYSFGTMPILKLASKLESEGYQGIVFCLDGSPLYLQMLVHNILDCSNDFSLQNSLILYFVNLYLKGNVPAEIFSKLDLSQSIEERVTLMTELSQFSGTYSKEFLIKICLATFSRIKEVLAYKDSEINKFKSPVVLLRAKKTLSYMTSFDKHYGLHLFTDGGVSTHHFEADHISITENEDCAKTINKILSKLDQGAATIHDIVSNTNDKKYRIGS